MDDEVWVSVPAVPVIVRDNAKGTVADVVFMVSVEDPPPVIEGGTIRILVFGGSQGARVMSDIVPPAIEQLPIELRSRLEITQQARDEDLERGDHDRIVRAAIDTGLDALIVSNTTISRPPLASPLANEAGGLSGRPLKRLALEQLRKFRAASGA